MSKRKILSLPIDPYGTIIGSSIILFWTISLLYLLNWNLSFSNPLTYLMVLIQTHLYTGLFITAHDSMHGTVSKNMKLNKFLGWITSLLFAYNFYNFLFEKHHEHHKHVASEKDPDYHESGKLGIWYWNFIKRYTNLKQLILMGTTLTVLSFIFPIENILLFWMFPSALATFQLFYFGTYIPHKNGHEHHDNKHKATTQKKNHLVAFLTCYFFGYHYEHHDAPGVPWWRLWKMK